LGGCGGLAREHCDQEQTEPEPGRDGFTVLTVHRYLSVKERRLKGAGVKLFFGGQGEMRDRTYEDQLNAASLNLLLAAIVVCNTVNMQACIRDFRPMVRLSATTTCAICHH
jgi:hypothetical protein